MDMGTADRWTPRQKVLSAAAVAVAKTAGLGSPIVSANVAASILSDYPGCGVTLVELAQWIDDLAVNASLAKPHSTTTRPIR